MEISFFVQHLLFSLVIFVVSLLLTLFLKNNLAIFDIPNERSSHVRKTPRGGGVAIVAGFLIGISLIHLIGDETPIFTLHFVGFLTASLTIGILSFYDDFKPVTFRVKLLGQILAVFLVMFCGITIDEWHLPWHGELKWGWWTIPLTFLWLMGMTNAFNFFDGLDGLAASTAAIAAGFLAYISYQAGSHFVYLASLTLAAATTGFLCFNWSPAKIFMGDVGSTFIGFVFAVMAIIAARYDHSHTSMLVVPMLFLHVIFDTLFTFARRLLAGANVFTAHRSHIYQLLNRTGYSHQSVTLIYSFMAICQGLGAILMMRISGDMRIWIFVPFLVVYSVVARMVLEKSKSLGDI